MRTVGGEQDGIEIQPRHGGETEEEVMNRSQLRDARMRYSDGTPTEGEGRGAQGEKRVFLEQ
jgi:hypothetical protein